MSIPVATTDLARVRSSFGEAYLVTVGEDGSPKAVLVDPVVDGASGVVEVPDCGRGSRRNAVARPTLTLVFPPSEPRGYTLLVDGTGSVQGADDGTLRIAPTGAVLHRPGRHADGPPPPAAAGEQGDACRVS